MKVIILHVLLMNRMDRHHSIYAAAAAAADNDDDKDNHWLLRNEHKLRHGSNLLFIAAYVEHY